MTNANLAAPEAERAVIGSMLIEKEAISACIDLLPPECLYEAQNQAICRIAYDLFRANRPADVVAVIEAGKAQALAFPELPAYLGKCIESVTSASHASHHARTVLDRYYKRQTILAATKLVSDLYSEEKTDESLRALQDTVLAKEAIYAPAHVTYKNDLHDFLDKMGEKSKSALYRTGYKSLDALWYGLSESELVVIAGAPGAGKSKLALNIMGNLLARNVPCLYFGTEMTPHETIQRHLSMITKIETWKMRIGKVDLTDSVKINEALAGMSAMPLHLSRINSPSLSDISTGIVNSKAKVVFVDSLLFCNLPKAEALRIRIEEFVRGLKVMAQKREVVIFLICHLGRQTYNAESSTRPPTLADIGESKAVEIAADKALLLWAPQAKQTGINEVVECINAKDRANNKKRGGMSASFDLICDEKTPIMRERELA